MTSFSQVAPVLPVRDVDAAGEHYRRLGFTVELFPGGEYAFADRGEVSLHLSLSPDHDPLSTAATVYLYVADADALAAEWAHSGVAGRFIAPVDTDYGLREGAHVDADGNLLRYGSPLNPQRH